MPRTVKLTSVLAFALSLHAGAPRVFAQSLNVVIQWNHIIQTQFGTAPSNAQRSLSMMHIAMFDAINSIEEAYTPYLIRVRGSHGASPDVAGAAAARDVLTALYPAQQAVFDAALAEQLKNVPRGHARQGLEIGRRAALAVLAWRQDDGWPPAITPDPTYVLPPFPGLWQPTPPANSFATFTFYPRVKPFALLTSTQLLAAPPPTLTSARYAADLNETKLLGSATSAARTPDETLFAQLVAGINTTVGFLHVWNIVAGDVAERHGLSLVDTARLFALLNVSMHDGLQTSFTSKFTYATYCGTGPPPPAGAWEWAYRAVPQPSQWVKPVAQTSFWSKLGWSAAALGLTALTVVAVVSPFDGPAGDVAAGSAAVGAWGRVFAGAAAAGL